LIFNGNIRTPEKLKSFLSFLKFYNKNQKKISKKLKKFALDNTIFTTILPIINLKPVTLEDN
jgi:hypothetical protein